MSRRGRNSGGPRQSGGGRQQAGPVAVAMAVIATSGPIPGNPICA